MAKKHKKRKKGGFLSTLGNIIFFILNIFPVLNWLLRGLFLCCTIIGIPLGLQCFKMARLSAFPFGKKLVRKRKEMSFLELVINIIWLVTGGFAVCLYYLFTGILLCITIIFIPFGNQYFKLAKLSLMPFGTEIVDE